MACAYSLSRCDEFDVTVVDKERVCGGVATSEKFGGAWFNDGVQGGALDTYANVLRLHSVFGFQPSKVSLNVSFGTGKWRWTNYQRELPELMRKIEPDIRAFKVLMDRVFALGGMFMLIDIQTLLRWLRYSPEFIDHYVLALTALFFGTGNQTCAVPAAVMARVFCDPQFAIFRLDAKRFIGQSADFFAFSDLRTIYTTMQTVMAKEKGVKFLLGSAVSRVERDEVAGCQVALQDGTVLQADHIVFACEAQGALKVLGEGASWIERWSLSGVEYYSDVTYTHTDEAYMRKEFGWEGPASPCMYMIRPYEHDPSRGEMGFVLSNYQRHLPAEQGPLFQTIFLDHDHDASHWTLPLLDKSKIVLEKWWSQFAHSRRHFLRVVPFVRFLQSPRSLFCGSWTMVNTHEAATISGFAAAHRLGAPYPFERKGFSYEQFVAYLKMIHGC